MTVPDDAPTLLVAQADGGAGRPPMLPYEPATEVISWACEARVVVAVFGRVALLVLPRKA